ncbi:monoglyceride lipase-like [Amblyomma americanum]
MSSFGVVVDESTSFLNDAAYNIVCKSWRPGGAEPRALLFLAHGYGDHCHDQSYDTLARSLAQLGVYVFSHDHVGHGKSEGPRATVSTFDVYVDDIFTHVGTERSKYSGKPVFLLGYSMGGLLVIMAAQRKRTDFAGMILLAPLLGLGANYCAPPFALTIARLLGCVLPCLPVGTMNNEMMCRDRAVVHRMDNDPLSYTGTVSVRWVAALVDALEAVHADIKAVELPLLVQYGTGDKICDPEATKQFFEKAPSKDKTIKNYEGAYHSLLEEPEGVGQQVLKDIVEWLSARLPAGIARHDQPGPSGSQRCTPALDEPGPSGRQKSIPETIPESGLTETSGLTGPPRMP